MRKLLLILSSLLLVLNLAAESRLKVFNVNTEEYPKIKAELLVLDEFDQQVQITSITDLRVTEEGISREVTGVSCPTPTDNKKISVILVFDVSTSMQGERLAQAKTASKNLVNLVLEREGSEVSVIAFADKAFVASDFDEDISNLESTIDALEANGSTNYENPFLDPISGAINLAEKAKNEVHIFFMTDGYGKLEPEKVIINSSKASLIVHTIAFNIAIPEVLKLVSDNTGGLSFNNLQSETELVDAFSDILDFAQESNRCTIEWQTQGCLTDREVRIDYLPKSLRDEFSYFTAAENFAFFAYPNDRFAIFEQPSTIQIPVTSQNGSIRIDSIVSNNKAFIVLSPSLSGPILVEPGEQIQISLEFDPEDDKLSTAVITIHSSSCRFNQIFAIGGNDGSIPSGDGLELVSPLGGEVYNKNTDTVIEWKGVLPTQVVKLEFSSDSGTNWQPITDEADSLVFRHRYPDLVSDICKVRVSQESSTVGQKIYGKPDSLYDVIDLSWDRSGYRIALAHTDGNLEVISSVNGNTQMSFALPAGLIAVDYSFDDIRISTADSRNVYMSNMISGQTDTVIKFDNTFRITDLKFHPNGKLMAVAGRDSILEVYDIRTWEKQESVFLDAGEITSVEWSPDGTKISVTTNNIKVYIVDTLDYDNPISFDATDNTRRLVTASSWSPDGKSIAVSTNLRRSKVFDTETLIEVSDYQHHTVSLLNDIAWHPELNTIVSIAEDSRSIVFDSDESDNDLAVIYDFSNSYYFNQVEWSPSGNRFAIALSNQLSGESVIVYSFDNFVLQSDESKVFSLVDQDIDQKDIFVGTTVIGEPLDNNKLGFIINTSNFDVVIDSLTLEGEEFDISGNIFPKAIAPGDSIGMFSQFTPNTAGLISFVLTSHTNIGEYQSQISGEGSNSDLSALIREIDFGEVLVNTSVDTTVAVVFNTSLQAISYSDQSLLSIPNTPYQLNNAVQGQIEPSDSLRLDLTFAPVSEGIKQNIVSINNESELDPFQVKVTGLGVAPIIVLPDTIEHKRGVCSEKIIDSIIVKNTGSGSLLISDIDYLGTGDLLITQKDHSIGAGDSTYIVYEAQLENSSLIGTLSFVSNAFNSQNNMSVVFRLSTSQPEFKISGGVDFPISGLNDQVTSQITVTNTGTSQISWEYVTPFEFGNGFELLGITPLSIDSGEESIFEFRYSSGNVEGVFNDSLNLGYLCSDSTYVLATAAVGSDLPIIAVKIIEITDTIGCDQSGIIELEFSNLGTAPLEIGDVVSKLNIEGLEILANSTLLAGQTETYTFTLSSIVKGNVIGSITIMSDGANADANGNYSVDLQYFVGDYSVGVEPEILEYGEGNSSTQFGVTNLGNISTEYNVVTPPGVQASPSIFELPVGGDLQVQIEINSNSYVSGEILLIGCDTVTIALESDQKKPSIKIVAPVLVSRTGVVENLEFSVESSIRIGKPVHINILTNSTLLRPVERDIRDRLGKKYEHIFTFDSIAAGLQSITIPYNTAWGNDSISAIGIELEVEPETNSIGFDLIAGSVLLSDICQASGGRLFQPNYYERISTSVIDRTLVFNNISRQIETEAVYRIFDIKGKVRSEGSLQLKNQSSINISSLERGGYFVVIEPDSSENQIVIKFQIR